MAEEKAKEPKEAKEKKPGGIKGYLFFGVGSFIIFLILFTFLSGAFQQKKVVPPTETTETKENPAEEQKSQDTTSTETKVDTFSTYVPDSLKKADSTMVLSPLEKEKEEIKKEREKLETEKKELELLKVEVKSLLEKKEEFENERILSLAKLYEGMKADKAALFLDKLDESTTVAILNKMKKQNASKVMGYFAPDKAAKISKEMLGQKQENQ